MTGELGKLKFKLLVKRAGAGLRSREDIRQGEARQAVARLHSVTGPGASGWLTAVPSSATLHIPPSDFRFACRFRLGLQQPCCLALGGAECGCGRAVDVRGYHLLTCGTGPERTLKHDCLRDAVGTCLFSRARIPFTREIPLGRLGWRPRAPSSEWT